MDINNIKGNFDTTFLNGFRVITSDKLSSYKNINRKLPKSKRIKKKIIKSKGRYIRIPIASNKIYVEGNNIFCDKYTLKKIKKMIENGDFDKLKVSEEENEKIMKEFRKPLYPYEFNVSKEQNKLSKLPRIIS